MSDEYDPWVAGWLLGKYQQHQALPTTEQVEEWLEGFKTGTTEVCEFHIWPQRLREYLADDNSNMAMILKNQH